MNYKKYKVPDFVHLSFWSPQTSVEKRNCVELKYYDDEYIKYICPKTSQKAELSLFNYMRVMGNRKIIERFFECFKNEKVQFVNLGSGLDTVSLWILKHFPNAVCYDVDLELQMKIKVDIFKSNREISSLFPDFEVTESTLHSSRYHMFPCDLRDVTQLNKLKQHGFSDKLPTIYLSEYVLTYIENYLSNEVIKTLYNFSSAPSILIFQEYISYSGYIWNEAKSMLKDSGTPMYSLDEYPNVEAQIKRYKDLGWDDTLVVYYNFVFNSMIDQEERSRLVKIENFNDFESLGIFFSHSIIGTALKNPKHLAHVVQLLKQPDSKKAGEECLIPYFSYEVEEKMDHHPVLQLLKNVLEVTYNSDSEDCKSFYSKFK